MKLQDKYPVGTHVIFTKDSQYPGESGTVIYDCFCPHDSVLIKTEAGAALLQEDAAHHIEPLLPIGTVVRWAEDDRPEVISTVTAHKEVDGFWREEITVSYPNIGPMLVTLEPLERTSLIVVSSTTSTQCCSESGNQTNISLLHIQMVCKTCGKDVA